MRKWIISVGQTSPFDVRVAKLGSALTGNRLNLPSLSSITDNPTIEMTICIWKTVNVRVAKLGGVPWLAID